ncbi:MAG: NAD(P)-binding domain-containing protein [Clostridia bacterium]|nr:NAD(P)-binding domain-containing protein [Clostridia bacterium]
MGVYGGNELLEYKEFPDFSEKTVCVIGGGNTAMDVARTVNKKNAKKVIVIYRRAREQMPAEDEEVEAASLDGVEFWFQNNIVKIIGETRVEQIECIKTELVKVEGDREKPVNIEGSNYIRDMDFVIMALRCKAR